MLDNGVARDNGPHSPQGVGRREMSTGWEVRRKCADAGTAIVCLDPQARPLAPSQAALRPSAGSPHPAP